jgi:hypothetical protein
MGARRVAAGLLAAVIAAGALVACEPPASAGTIGRGGYVGQPTAAAVQAFSDLVGPPATDHVLSFVPQGPAGTRGFRQIDGWVDDVLPLLDGQPRRLVLSVPLVPTGSTFASVIAGDGHRRLTKLGAALRAADRGRSVIRLGWESNAAWPRWRAVGHERDYRRAFRAVVTSLNDATLVRTFLCWANGHSVAYHNYWDVQKAGEADTRLEQQPEALDAYRANCA